MTDNVLATVNSLALVGAGKMGAAMLEQWLARGLDPGKITIFEPQPSAQIAALAARGVRINPPKNLSKTGTPFAVVIVAVKPQIADTVLPDLRALVSAETLVLSIMAGRALAFLEKHLPQAGIVRAMPNLPASIGCGVTVAIANKNVGKQARANADALLGATGLVEWIEDESLIDAVTGLSGTGPAYVFLLAETLEQAGIAAGLPQALSARLARATIAGAGELLKRSPLPPGTLRENVTSPGGTAAAALAILRASDGLGLLMEKAVLAATKRARELS